MEIHVNISLISISSYLQVLLFDYINFTFHIVKLETPVIDDVTN